MQRRRLDGDDTDQDAPAAEPDGSKPMTHRKPDPARSSVESVAPDKRGPTRLTRPSWKVTDRDTHPRSTQPALRAGDPPLSSPPAEAARSRETSQETYRQSDWLFRFGPKMHSLGKSRDWLAAETHSRFWDSRKRW